MISKLVKLVKSFIFIVFGVNDIGPVDETYPFSEDVNVRKPVTDSEILRQKHMEQIQFFIQVEHYMQAEKDRELDNRKKIFREWVDNCEQVFKPTRPYQI